MNQKVLNVPKSAQICPDFSEFLGIGLQSSESFKTNLNFRNVLFISHICVINLNEILIKQV